MLPPFRLPVHVEQSGDSLVLTAYDCELIAVLEAATDDEAAYIVHCINAQATKDNSIEDRLKALETDVKALKLGAHSRYR